MDEAIEGVFRGQGVRFETSGTTGGGRVVELSPAALLASARAVNAHLEATEGDVWVRAIPVDHVGGFGILLRAELSGSRVVEMAEKWNIRGFVDLVAREGGTLISLVPTQVFDLVKGGVESPGTVRAVVVGGGELEAGLCAAARELGWPVLRSYGMTEAGSQIATEELGGGRMRLLGDWEVRVGERGGAEIRGSALFAGYVDAVSGATVDARGEEGWFRTSDRVELGEDESGVYVQGVRREGRVVKVLGELVDLDVIERAVGSGVVVGVADKRAGMRVVLVVEEDGIDVGGYNLRVRGPARISEVVRVEAIPRGELGKPRYAALVDLIGLGGETGGGGGGLKFPELL